WTWAADTVFFVLASVRDLGVNGQIVRAKVRPFGNFLVIETAMGALMGVLILVFAPWLALAYSDASPMVVEVIRLLALYLFFDGIAKVPIVWFESEIA